VTFDIAPERLALVDAYEKRVVEPGEFDILVGPSSVDADLLKARFVVEAPRFRSLEFPAWLAQRVKRSEADQSRIVSAQRLAKKSRKSVTFVGT